MFGYTGKKYLLKLNEVFSKKKDSSEIRFRSENDF